MALVSVVASIIGIAIALAIDWFPERASTASDDIDLLYDVLLIASVPIFVLVMTVAIYTVLAFGCQPGDLSDGEPIHGNSRLEVIWVTIPFIMVSALAVYGWIVLEDIEAKKSDPLVVNVTGQQFAWSFDYPAERVKSNQLVLPKNRPVEFRIKTRDVLHDFWVPEFRLKSDVVPGLTTKIRLTPSRLGSYDVVCAELCGIGHSTMRQTVQVIEPRASRRGSTSASRAPVTAAPRPRVATPPRPASGCSRAPAAARCHSLDDAGTTAAVGPGLDELASAAASRGKSEASRRSSTCARRSSRPARSWSRALPRGRMPANYGDDLSAAEIDALVEYLLGVAGGGDAK